ncbi:putative quinol monooxygenase [Sphingobacterium siyangense]|uniref:putative quinol monooxygenase n=1 Tax=Sphingobacterium siyangense TaxID=459529 RepID=UPI003DA57EE7
MKSLLSLPLTLIILFLCGDIVRGQDKESMVRIAEIEVYVEYLEEYKTILKEEAAASVALEEGVVAIFPMFKKDNPTQIRILEIYRDKQAYLAHLRTAHFLKYKSTTLHMVKLLKLIDMDVLDPNTAKLMFTKMKE